MSGFDSLGLDPRLLKALGKRGFEEPTPVQAATVPVALEGKDIVARAHTGSGKTLAYLLPAINRIVQNAQRDSWQALVLVPTRELCEQVRDEAASVLRHCGADFTATSISGGKSKTAQRTALATVGQLVVSTPGRLAEILKDGSLPPTVLQRVQTLVLDEADLLLSYGYEADLQAIAPSIPRSCQSMLMSATISEDVTRLMELMLQNPVTFDLIVDSPEGEGGDRGPGEASGISQTVQHFYVQGDRASDDRLLHLLTLLKITSGVEKKVLIYCNDINGGYRIRLFLEAFGIRCAMLNAELPLNSRHHILTQFNKGLFDYLIATDHAEETLVKGKEGGAKGPSQGRKKEKDWEFGVTRGIDFKGVKTVVNFDLPSSTDGYVHRVGRTGRAGQKGTAITLAQRKDSAALDELRALLVAPSAAPDAAGRAPTLLRALPGFTGASAEALRYRAEDVAAGLSKKKIQEARAKEIKAEILNSEKLREHFEENPQDLAILKHDKPLVDLQNAPHLKRIPAYLRETTGRKSFVPRSEGGSVPPPKRRKTAGGKDPLKAPAFLKAPKRGGAVDDELTEMEKRALAKGKRDANRLKKGRQGSGAKKVQ